MSYSLTNSEFKGYRIRNEISTEQSQPKDQYLLKIIVKNQSNGVPKIRHDVICNGKLYPFIPLFSFTSQDDLGVLQQMSTVVLRDQNEILCQILSKKITQVPTAQFQDLKKRFKNIFSLQLKVDPQELFLILVSEQVSDETEFNSIFDSISETQFVGLMKKVYQNCPNRLIPKILRRINKYLNSTKGRTQRSIQTFKKLLKIIKSTDETIDSQQKIYSFRKLQSSPQKEQQIIEQKLQKPIVSKKDSIIQKKPEQEKQVSKEKKQVKKEQKKKQQKKQQKKEQKSQSQSQKPVLTLTKQQVEAAKKQAQAKRIQKTKEKKAKQAEKKIQQQKPSLTQQQQNSSDWHDVQNSNDEDQEITNTIGKMAFHADESDEDTKYQAPKKKNNKKKAIIQLEPQFDSSAANKKQKLKKQNKNQSNSDVNNIKQKYRKVSNGSEQNAEDKIVEQQQTQNRRNKNNQNNKRNNNGDQSLDKGNKQFTRDKKIDPRILFGINGAPDSVWRERMRPQKYQRDQERNQTSKGKQNYQNKTIKASPVVQQKSVKQNKPKEVKQSKNMKLQKIFSIPEDVKEGKKFKFQKRHYNLFVNKLFWVNITDDQLTIQKEGKGYIRKCPVQIIDNGKGIMAQGLTLNIDGLSNLQDGGIVFGDPNFEQFTPHGQWFHIQSLDVYTYV